MKPGETEEWLLADQIEASEIARDLTDWGREVIVKCLRDRARWMATDIKSGERKSSKGQNR